VRLEELSSLNQNLLGIIERYRDPTGKLNYFAMMADKALVDYAESLADFDLTTLESREEQLAFWINCYNSLSIYGVVKKLQSNPDFINKGNKSWFSRVRFFALQRFIVGGKSYTLRTIENNIRDDFKDPRIHFALNCSSLGCPLLKDGLYSAENIDIELDAATKLYLRSPEGLRLDEDSGDLSVSMVFKWYANDFETPERTIVDFIKEYAPQKIQDFIEKSGPKIKIKYIEYDWALNISDQEKS